MAFSINPEKESFYHKVYLTAALLDPNTKLTWVDLDVQFMSDSLEEELSKAEVSEQRDSLKREIKGNNSVFYEIAWSSFCSNSCLSTTVFAQTRTTPKYVIKSVPLSVNMFFFGELNIISM